MKTRTPLFIAVIILVAMLLSMVSCTQPAKEKPIRTEASTIQDVRIKGSILYYKDKPVIMDDSCRELFQNLTNQTPTVATYVVEYKSYYFMVLD